MEDDDNYRPPRHWGDFGALVLAGGFSLFGLYLVVDLLMGGHPLAVLFRAPPQQEAPKPTEADWRDKKFTTAPGEVVISTATGLPVGTTDSGFPSIKDWGSLRITLSRSVCYGTCPVYSVQIAGDGTVVYHGQDCVAQSGEQRARIPTATVRALLDAFRQAGFFSLHERYAASITDNPTYSTSIAFDGRKKTVSDYAGGAVGMPEAVSALEDAIDRAAGTERWVYGGKRTCFGAPVDDSWRKTKRP